jgi:hypothetical protein
MSDHDARGRRGEEGAVLVIVTLLLLALLGMVTLTVDVGALLTRRRQLVTAADAAALAAAQSCGRKEGEALATAQALSYTEANGGSTASIPTGYPIYEPSCNHAAGRVTIRVEATQSLFFGPVLGTGRSAPVAAEAVAFWGGVSGGDFVPFMLSEGQLLHCGFTDAVFTSTEFPDEVRTGETCTFWMDNKEGYGSSQWAMLNLNTAESDRWGWNVPADHGGCVPANTEETLRWIEEGASGLTLEFPAPTYVCVDTGASPPAFQALAAQVGTVRLFPVSDPGVPVADWSSYSAYIPEGGPFGYTDVRLEQLDPPDDPAANDPATPYPHGQVNKAGEPCPPPCASGSSGYGSNGPVDKFDIVGFAKLEIVSVQRGNQGGEVTCGMPRDPNAWCLRVRWVDYFTEAMAPEGSGDNFNVTVIRLIR